ncbi:MAG: class I SAM-dependent methyltransferase [Niabella sp.]
MADAEKFTMFINRLTKTYRHLSKTARRQNISCYCIYNHDLPEFPFLIELYGRKIYIAEYKRRHQLQEEAHKQWLKKSIEIVANIVNIPLNNIFIKTRQRKAGRQGQYQKTNFTKNEFIVEENALKFIVNLHDYLDTGLFLDHRVTRKMVMDESKDKRVLNLFAYTGSFSVYAAAGGAAKVTTVDLSKTYLDWAERNMQSNGFAETKYDYIHADVLQYLTTVPNSSYDVIVIDPPTFSNSKRMKDFLDIQKDYVKLINECLRIIDKNGCIYFSTNYTKFQLNESLLKASAIKDITKATTPFDFTGKLQRVCYRIS